MFRHARAALLAGAVLCAAAPAFAAESEWWVVSTASEAGDGVNGLIDVGSSKIVSPGVVEVRGLGELIEAGKTVGWIDTWVQYDCAQGRARIARATAYNRQLTATRDLPEGMDWAPMPAGDAPTLFLCKGERAGFHKRDGFTPPVG